MDEHIAELAPHPWRIADHTTNRVGYLNRICDFFPFAAEGGRGKEATLALAQQILDWSNTSG